MNIDVLIIGGGIAGVTLAHLLSQQNIETLLLQKNSHQANPVLLGESIPPTAIPMLKRLGIYHFLEKEPHFKSYGYQSVWGGDKVVDYSFDHYENPYGVKISKDAWAKDILQESKCDVNFCKQILYIEENDSMTKVLCLDEDDNEVAYTCKVLVDATGRSAYLARKMGDERYYSDDLLAFCCNVESIENEEFFRPVLVESFEHGWAIVSKLNEAQNALTIFTRSITGLGGKCKDVSNWQDILSSTVLLKDFIPSESKVAVKGMSSGSSILTKMVGNNWLAIGDAAMAFDPLSSHGVTTSLYSAEQAALAIANALSNERAKPMAFKSYSNNMRSLYGTYLGEKKRIYSMENRWEDFVFWKN